MISTKKLISHISQVPKEWVFEYYLNLRETLSGQDVKILSVFNSSDSVPSMFIYYDVVSSSYKFKDFSSGYQGDAVQLVMYLFSYPTRWRAASKIINDYSEFITSNNVFEKAVLKPHAKYRVSDYQIRSWNNLDAKYWTSFGISSKTLKKYNVHPLEYYTMTKQEESKAYSITSDRLFTYGYFRNDGELFKIYMPKNKDKKFIKVENYIQGMDQLTYETDYLIILSSLKDAMSFEELNISNIEQIAPDSENSMIQESVMNNLKEKYRNIIVMFDNDEPGIKSMNAYKNKYDLNFINLNLSKDLSDSVKDYGKEKVLEKLFPLLKNSV